MKHTRKLLKFRILLKPKENNDVHQWTTTNPSTKLRATELKTPTVVTMVAEVLREAHQANLEITMVTMVTMVTATVTANKKGTTNSKMVPNQHAGGVTSTDTVKKTAANESKQTLHAKVSMALPIGQNKKPSSVGEDEEQQEAQGAVGEMYTGQFANVFFGFQ